MRAKVAYILIITVAGMFFLFRESVNTYWMQSYHQDSPLMEIERWITGKKSEFIDSIFVDSIVEEDQLDQIAGQTAGQIKDGVAERDHAVMAGQSIDERPSSVDQMHEMNLSGDQQTLKEREVAKEGPKEAPEAEAEEVIVMGFVGPEFPQLPGTREVRAGDKLFFVGDSMMQGVAPRIKQALYQKEGIDGVDLSKQSTGLSYPNFYNWPKVVEETLAKDQDIRVMVVYLGANDPWDFPVPGRKQYLRFKSAEWERVYRSRIRQILLSAKAHDIPVIWLGAPCMRKDKLHNDMIYLNRLYQAEVERFNGYYLPTSEILGCSDAGYAAHVTTEKGQQRVRANDGIHFTVAGQRLVGNGVIDLLTIQSDDPEESAVEEITAEKKTTEKISKSTVAEAPAKKQAVMSERKAQEHRVTDRPIAPPLQLQSAPQEAEYPSSVKPNAIRSDGVEEGFIWE